MCFFGVFFSAFFNIYKMNGFLPVDLLQSFLRSWCHCNADLPAQAFVGHFLVLDFGSLLEGAQLLERGSKAHSLSWTIIILK
jgi:hypothetical protein